MDQEVIPAITGLSGLVRDDEHLGDPQLHSHVCEGAARNREMRAATILVKDTAEFPGDPSSDPPVRSWSWLRRRPQGRRLYWLSSNVLSDKCWLFSDRDHRLALVRCVRHRAILRRDRGRRRYVNTMAASNNTSGFVSGAPGTGKIMYAVRCQGRAPWTSRFVKREVTWDPGLLARYPFSEGIGAVATDASGYLHNGTIEGATWTTGMTGSSLLFDGVNDYISLGDPTALKPANLSVSLWFKTTATSGVLLRKRWYGYGLNMKSTGGVGFFVYNASGTKFEAVSTRAYNNNAWHHVTGTYDGPRVRLYVDGAVANVSAGPIYYGTGAIAIGRTETLPRDAADRRRRARLRSRAFRVQAASRGAKLLLHMDRANPRPRSSTPAETGGAWREAMRISRRRRSGSAPPAASSTARATISRCRTALIGVRLPGLAIHYGPDTARSRATRTYLPEPDNTNRFQFAEQRHAEFCVQRRHQRQPELSRRPPQCRYRRANQTGTTFRLFIGTQVASTTNSYVIDNHAGPLIIGDNTYGGVGGDSFHGYLDEVVIVRGNAV